MRRTGSRYGLPPTNQSLKYAMQEFQDVAGCYGVIRLPGTKVALSLKKQARWKWVDSHTTDPTWNLHDSPVLWCKSFTTAGLDYLPVQTRAGKADDSASQIIDVEYFGRFSALPHKKAVAEKGDHDVIFDERYLAYSAAQCCGCSMCSDKPRNKSKQKCKGRRKYSNDLNY